MKTRKKCLSALFSGMFLIAMSALVLSTRASAANYLIDDSTIRGSSTTIQSGWSFDNRGGFPMSTDLASHDLNDISTSFGTRFIRTFAAQSGGTMTLETAASISSGSDGFYYEFQSSAGTAAYKLITDNGCFNIVENGTETPLSLADAKGSYTFKIILNLDTGTSRTIINGTDYGSHSFAGTAADVSKLIIGTTPEDAVYVIPTYAVLYSNYAVNERFTQTSGGNIPYDWTRTVTGSASASVVSNEMVLALTGTGSASAAKTFTAVSGKVCYETLFMLPALADGAEFKMMSGTNVGVSVKTLNNKIYAGTTELRGYYDANMWYQLRIEADTATNTAVIKINGKTLGTVNFENAVTSFDSIEATISGTAAATLKFDDPAVYVIPVVSDYVPEPVIPTKSTASYIGINVCSLWRNGEHVGWDKITPFDELKPVLGYYDDFTPEVADWEIKFLAEHGVDYESYCWYSSQSNAPIKTTSLSGALEKGYMNAKYSGDMKFGIIWEAANGAHPASSAAFRTYFVPYWVEKFFTDSRYMLIDNKPVISVFGYNQLITDFGSAANVAAELNYVRTVCQGLGYDGAIFIACCGSTDSPTLQTVANCGFDAVQAYNWGKSGNDPTYTQNCINAQYSYENIIHVIPTVSTGFNNVGWAGTRSPNMTVPDFADMMLWVRNTALARNDPASWKSKLAIISTWNEYGEGTYVMPAGLNGFGYLDGVRAAFTSNPSHADTVPTTTQKARLDYLFPQDKSLIKPLKIDASLSYPQDVLQSWNYVVNRSLSTAWYYSNMAAPTVNTDGCLNSTATGTDPIIQMKNDANIDISGIHYIKVRAAGYPGDNIQVFYTTAADNTWTEGKSVAIPVSSNVMKDYYLPIYTKSSWAGTLKKLRVDPLSSTHGFSIESISLMYDASNIYQTWNFVVSGAASTVWDYSSMTTPTVGGGTVSSTASNSDPIISIKNDINLDISNVTYIKVRASGPVGNTVQVFYTTAADGTWTEAKSVSATIASTAMTDYYLPVYTKSTWTGTLKRLRVDPISTQNTFSIESVALLYNASPVVVNVNQTKVPLWCSPISKNSHYLIPIAPDTGVQYYFGAYFEWDKASGILTMYANNHTIAFTMGNSNASVDGVSTALGCTPYLLDGIPMVPVDALTSAFGYTISYGSGTIDITTPFSSYFDTIRDEQNNLWEFNIPNYPEGWTFGNASADYSETGAIGGSAVYTGTMYDPIIYSPSVNIVPGTYSSIKIGMKHAMTTATSNVAQVFYVTSDSPNWTADKCITGTPTITTQTSGGNYIEYTFNLSSVTGTITQFRFDPFNAQGDFYVDYIRFQQ